MLLESGKIHFAFTKEKKRLTNLQGHVKMKAQSIMPNVCPVNQPMKVGGIAEPYYY